MPAFEKLNSI